MKTRPSFYALAALSLLAVDMAAGLAAPAPRVALISLDKLPQPLPLPYDETANANRQVAAAKARARSEGKLLLIDLGGNWCPDCRIFAAVLALPEVKAFVGRHYVVVTVDIGHLDKNLQIPGGFGVNQLKGVPAVLVVNPRTGELLDRDHLFALADARHMTPQALADWLAQWV